MVLVPVLALRERPATSRPTEVRAVTPATAADVVDETGSGGGALVGAAGAVLAAPAPSPPPTVAAPPVTRPPATPPHTHVTTAAATRRRAGPATTLTVPPPTTTTIPFLPTRSETGVASFYEAAPHGACAHRTLAKGTLVRVTNVESGRQVFCRVSDRGPYSDGRMIDLSRAAFAELAPASRGLLTVQIEW